MLFKTKVIYKNGKTGFSVDFGTCKLMYKDVGGKYKSDWCNGCYAVKLLNLYPAVRAKLENSQLPSLKDFKDDISKIKSTGLRFIRFFSLGDFNDPAEIEYIRAAAEILPVELFSKTLHTQWRHLIPEIAKIPHVNISLSFNKSWDDNYRENVWLFLKENHLLKNVQLNYTFIGDEQIVFKSYVSVYHHTTPTGKMQLKNIFGKNRVCCMRDKDGKEIFGNKSSNTKGSCKSCPLCKLPAAQQDGQILIPKLLEKVYKVHALANNI